MIMHEQLQYLQRQKLDAIKWDQCIDESPNGLIYAYTFFLDKMAPQWAALVWGDYEAVLPVPHNKKWGIDYMYNPCFVQRLDIFGTTVTTEMTMAFYHAMYSRFRYIDIDMGTLPAEMAFKNYTRPNYIISLQQTYEQVRHNYSKECVRNIQKAQKRGCTYTEEIPVEEIIRLYKQVYGKHIPRFGERGYRQLQLLCEEAIQLNRLTACGVVSKEDGGLLLGALLFHDNRRIYYAIAAPTGAGKEARATYFFIDYLLQTYAGKYELFDFGGSDIAAVAEFYKRFGPAEETYYHIFYNQLPWWIRWAKK